MRTFEEKTIGGSQFLICGLQEELLDTVALGMMSNNHISGLLPMIAQQVDGIFKFQFDITGKQPLDRCMPKLKNAEKKLEILAQIASVVSSLREYMIEEEQLVLDDRYIYLNREMTEVFLACVPSEGQPDQALSFQKYCFAALSAIPMEYRVPVAMYQKAMDSLEAATFDPNAFSEQIKKALARSVVERSKSTSAPVVLERDAQNRAEQSSAVLRHDNSAVIPQPEHTVFSGGQDRPASGPIILQRNGEPEPESGTILLKRDASSDQTDAIQPEEELTMPLCRNHPTVRGFLRRQSTSEKIEITSPEFRIGKSYHDLDYRIDGNPAVSRYHAKIIQRGDDFFIVDTNSKNHTYVNRTLIESNQEVPLTDATSIRLANEEFVFLVSR